ncbi:MAG: benzoate/H(+) symporter BenE family transporter [Desulfosporosinus sp.]|nr:benzoate/H(+) symporter BenE family transporter [Desulfosporosinus sp.]
MNPKATISFSTPNSQRFEHGPGLASGLRDLPRYLNVNTVTTGLVAAVFGCTGPALIVLNAATKGHLTTVQAISWLFGIYFLGGLVSVLMALYYKQPICGAYNIPAAVMLVSSLSMFSLNQAVGAYIIAGVLVFILGVSGLIGKVMRLLPLPIVMAMIAGAMIHFGTGIITSTQSSPYIGLAALIGFLILPRISKKIPPVLGALVLGIIVAGVVGGLHWSGEQYKFIAPRLVMPQFTLNAVFSIAIPLAALVIGSENAQAIGVLTGQGYQAPVNMITMVSGIGSILVSFFGGHNVNIAGPMTAICATEEAGENKEGRYAAAVVNGVVFGGFGLIASIAVAFVSDLPKDLIGIVAGLAMIGVLISAFNEAFSSKKFKHGAFFALVIAMSGVTLLKISAPFWALVGGAIVSFLVEPKDFESTKIMQ